MKSVRYKLWQVQLLEPTASHQGLLRVSASSQAFPFAHTAWEGHVKCLSPGNVYYKPICGFRSSLGVLQINHRPYFATRSNFASVKV